MENEPLFNDIEDIRNISTVEVDIPNPPSCNIPGADNIYVATPIDEDVVAKMSPADEIINSVVNPDPEAKRKEIVNKINQFQSTFSRIPLNLPKKNWEKMELDRLEAILQEGENKLKTENGANAMANLFFQFSLMVEVGLSTQTPYDITGYTQKLQEQEEHINKLIAQLCYKYYEQIQYFANPELQLGMILLFTGFSTYKKNQIMKHMLMGRSEEEQNKIKDTLNM